MNKKIHVCYIVFDLDLYKNFIGIPCRILNSYVDSIKIFYVGPESYFHYGDYLKSIDKVELYQYKGYVGNIEPLFRMIFSVVDVDDWILIQDADEIAEPSLLSNIRNVIEKLDMENSAIGIIPVRTHEFFRKSESTHGKVIYSEPWQSIVSTDPFPTETEFRSGNVGYWFTANKLIKRTQFVQPFSVYGLHYKIQPETKYKNNDKYISYGINHFKIYREWFSSYVLSGFTNPFVHGAASINIKDPHDLELLNTFDRLKLKYNIRTSNQFVISIMDESLQSEFIDFLLNLQPVYGNWGSQDFIGNKGYFGHLSRWVHTYGLNIMYNSNVRDLKLCRSFCNYESNY